MNFKKIRRTLFKFIDRHNLTMGEITSPDLGKDDAETLKLKLQYGIHQSVMPGPDTHTVSGVRAVAEGIDIIGKIDKSELYSLGYDIREENEVFVKDLGLMPGQSFCRPPVVAPDLSEEEVLGLERVEILHYLGKPNERPWGMRPSEPTTEEEALYPTAVAELVVPELEESVKARIEAFHAKAKDHDSSCEWYTHYMEHIDKLGQEFDCLYDPCNCKGNHGDDQGDAVPVQ
jgi:hypothetical protein